MVRTPLFLCSNSIVELAHLINVRKNIARLIQIISTEWGAFSNGLPLTVFDREMDATSINPGQQVSFWLFAPSMLVISTKWRSQKGNLSLFISLSRSLRRQSQECI
jgi:hypothetical protein